PCRAARAVARLPADPRFERLEAAGRRAADRAHPAASAGQHRPALLPAVDDDAAPAGVVLAPLPEPRALPPVRAFQPGFVARADRIPAAVRAGARPETARLDVVVLVCRLRRPLYAHRAVVDERLRDRRGPCRAARRAAVPRRPVRLLHVLPWRAGAAQARPAAPHALLPDDFARRRVWRGARRDPRAADAARLFRARDRAGPSCPSPRFEIEANFHVG